MQMEEATLEGGRAEPGGGPHVNNPSPLQRVVTTTSGGAVDDFALHFADTNVHISAAALSTVAVRRAALSHLHE